MKTWLNFCADSHKTVSNMKKMSEEIFFCARQPRYFPVSFSTSVNVQQHIYFLSLCRLEPLSLSRFISAKFSTHYTEFNGMPRHMMKKLWKFHVLKKIYFPHWNEFIIILITPDEYDDVPIFKFHSEIEWREFSFLTSRIYMWWWTWMSLSFLIFHMKNHYLTEVILVECSMFNFPFTYIHSHRVAGYSQHSSSLKMMSSRRFKDFSKWKLH